MANDRRLKLWRGLSNNGFDIGSYDEFDKAMNDATRRKKFYDAVSEHYDIGNFDDFEGAISPTKYKLKVGDREVGVSEKEYKDFLRRSAQPSTPKPEQPQQPKPAKPFKAPAGWGELDARYATRPAFTKNEISDYVNEIDKREQAEMRDAVTKNIGKKMQQAKDRADYFAATGKPLEHKHKGVEWEKIGYAPTVERDESGEIVYNNQGEPEVGMINDKTRANFQVEETERIRKENIDNQIKELRLRQNELRKEMMKRKSPDYLSGQDALSPYADPRTTDSELASLDAAYRQTEEQIRGLELEKTGGQQGFFKGLLTTAKDPNTWMMGYGNMEDAMNMLRISEKVRNKQPLTDAEKTMLEATMGNLQQQSKLSEDSDWLYRAGAMTTAMVPFALQIGLVDGFGGVAAIGSRMGQDLAKRYIAKFGEEALMNRVAANVLKATGVALGDIAAGFTSAVTTNAGNTLNDIIERKTGDLTINDKGEYDFEGAEDWFRAVGKGVVSQTKEFATERFGMHLPTLREMNVWFAKSGTGARKISRALSGLAGTKAMQKTADFLRKGGINGLGGEILEEEIGMPVDVAIGDMTWEDALSGKTQWDIVGGMIMSLGTMHAIGLATQGAVNAPSKAYNTAQYYKYKRRADKAANAASQSFGDAWSPLQAEIDGAKTEDMDAVWQRLRDDENLSNEQKRAAFNYMNALTMERGYNLGMFFAAQEQAKNPALAAQVAPITPAEQTEIDIMENNDRGYNLSEPTDIQDARTLYENQLQRAIDTFGEIRGLDEYPVQTIQTMEQGGYTPEQIQIAKDYVNAKAAYDGMQQRVNDDIDTQVAEATTLIDSHTNQEDNQVHPVTLKDGREVYITGRNVVLNEDGTVDVAATKEQLNDGMLFVTDNNGVVSSIDVDDIAEASAPVNADEEKQQVADAIRQQVTAEAQQKQQGILPFNVGDTYTVVDEKGQQHEVTVMQPPVADPQGTVNIVVSIDGAEAVQMSREQIQDMYNAASMARLQQYEEERQQAQAEAETEQQTETQEPVTYRINDIVTIQTENGPVVGNITAEENENGKIEVYTQEPLNGRRLNEFTREELDNMVVDVTPAEEVEQPEEPVAEQPQEPQTTKESPVAAEEYLSEQFDNDQEKKEQQPLEPMPMKGEDADFSQVTPERAHAYIYNEAGLSREEADQFVAANKKVADDALKKVKKVKKPIMGTSISKYKEALQEWQKEVEAAQQEADYWKQVQDIHKQADLEESKNTPTGRADLLEKKQNPAEKMKLAKELYGDYFNDDDVPQDIMELIAMNMPSNINWEGKDGKRGLQHELGLRRGIGKSYDSNGFNKYLAKTGEGQSFAEAVHSIYESNDNLLQDGEKRFDDQEIRNALIDMFMQADKPNYIRDYVVNSRIARAEDAMQADEARMAEYGEEYELQQWANRVWGMSFEEAIDWITNIDEIAGIRDEYENSQEYLDNLENNSNFANGNTESNDTGTAGQTGGMASEGARESETGGRSADEGTGTYQGQASDQTGVPQDTVGGNQETVSGVAGQVNNSPVSHREYIRAFLFSVGEEFVGLADSITDAQVEELYNLVDEWEAVNDVYGSVYEQNKVKLKSKDKDIREAAEEAVREAQAKADEAFEPVELCIRRLQLDSLSDEELIKFANDKEAKAENDDALYDDLEYVAAIDLMEERGIGERAGETTNTSSPEQIAAEEAKVNTAPTEAQKEAGNYQKGHIKVDGFDVTIENPKGSVRSGVDGDGKAWSQTMNNTYGYIRGTEGVDGDHIDVFLSENPEQGSVFVVDQVNPKTGEFDEHKVMYGFASAEEASQAYLANYEKDWKGLGVITEVSKEEFKKWVESSHRKTKPFSEYKSVKPVGAQNEGAEKPYTSFEELVADTDITVKDPARKQAMRKFVDKVFKHGSSNVRKDGRGVEYNFVYLADATTKADREMLKPWASSEKVEYNDDNPTATWVDEKEKRIYFIKYAPIGIGGPDWDMTIAGYKQIEKPAEETAGTETTEPQDEYLVPRDAEEEKIVADVTKKLQADIDAAIKARNKAASDLEKARVRESNRATDLFGNDDAFNQEGQLFGNSEMPVDQSAEGVERRIKTEQEAFNEAVANLTKLQSPQERNSRIRGALDNHRKQTSMEYAEGDKYEVGQQFDIIDDNNNAVLCRIRSIDEDGNIELSIGGHGNNYRKTVTPETLDEYRERYEISEKKDYIRTFIANHVDDEDDTFVEKLSNKETNKLHQMVIDYLDNFESQDDDYWNPMLDYIKQMREKYPVASEQISDKEVEDTINAMKLHALVTPTVEITEDNWQDNVETPIGNVKMGENQKSKLFVKGREQQYGMLLETLRNPDIVLEEMDKEQNVFHERPSSYLYVKTFQKPDGTKYVHFESVTVSQDGMEVSVSSHIIRENQLRNKLKSDRLLYKATALDEPANSSAEQPINEGSGLSSEGKGTEKNSSVQEKGKKNATFSVKKTTYTNKKGKTTPMFLVSVDRELSTEELRAGKALAKESRGWWDSKQGGFMMRDEDSVKQLVESLNNEETVADAQPLSLSDMAAQQTEQPTITKPQETTPQQEGRLERQARLAKEREEALKEHGVKIGDVVMYKGERATITDATKERVTLDTGMAPVIYEDVEWEYIKPIPAAEVQEAAAPSYGGGNKLVSRDRYEELKERMRKKLGGQMNMGIDPEILAIGVEMAAYHIEAGARSFADFAKRMVEELGDAIRPYLKAFYNGARELPEVEEAGYSNDMTPYEEVKAFDVANFDKPTTDVFATADQIVAEQEVAQQAEVAKEKITEQRNNGRVAQSEGVSLDGTPLRPVTEADIDSNNVEYYHNGKRVYIMAVMRSGEQIGAAQFSKPVIESIYLTNGKSVKLDELMTPDSKKEPISQKEVEKVVENAKNTRKKKGSAKKSVSLQRDLFADVEQNDNDNERSNGENPSTEQEGRAGASASANENVRGQRASEEESARPERRANSTRGIEGEDRRVSSGVSQGEPAGRRAADNSGLDTGLQERRNDGRADSSVSSGTEPVRSSTGRPNRRLQKLERPENPKNLRNNHAERGTDYAPASVDSRIDANIKAIELMHQLIENGEEATDEQKQVLRRYSGWGGLGKAFTEGSDINKRLRELLGEEEYQQAVMSRNSAYFTPAGVIDTMWDIARAMGFEGGNVLEGSAGIGNIIGLMPTDLSERSDIHAVEIDQTTGNILSLLYPDAKVEIKGFEQTQVENGTVNLAITNVPFVTGLRVMDTTGDKDLSKKFHDIHDFCIAKNVRKLREGGIGIFITSSGTLDNSSKLREWLVGEGNVDVVGAFRLNNETFGGTGATSDIIVVRKRVNGKKSPYAIDVLPITGERTAEYKTGDFKKVKGDYVPVVKQLSMDYNKYFVEHPEMMAGKMMFGFEKGDTFRPTSKALYPEKDKNQAEMLKAWADSFAEKEWNSGETVDEFKKGLDEMSSPYEALGADVKEGSMVVSNGLLCVAQRGRAVPLKSKPKKGEKVSDEELIARFHKNKVRKHTKAECLASYQAIKKALADVLEYQTTNEDDAGLQPLLKALNRAYDSFVNTYGHLHKNNQIAFLKNDVDFSSILALESFSERPDKNGERIQEFGKTDIFTGRVVDKEKEPEPQNVRDGIVSSIYVHGRVDIPWIAERLNMTEEQVKEEITSSGLGFENPATRQIEVSYEYLSGNVREKLAQAQENNKDGRYDANIKALEAVIPMNIPSHLIDFSIGSSWIDPKLYEDYIKEKTDIDVKCTSAGGTWFVKTPSWVGEQKNRAMGVTSEMLHKTIMGTQLIEAAMTNKTITVSETRKKYDGTTETVTDKEATQACANKIDEIRQDFKDWARAKMQSDPAMSELIERTYNEMFNNYVPTSIPDDFAPSHFGGQATTIKGRPFKLNPHQSKAAVRGTMQPLLLAHEVGSGKTYTLITTAMEMRRLGTARKPMIVVQNATVGQFVESAKELYPNAKVLTIEEADRTAEGRKNFYAKIKYNDWDMIVVPQSVLERIPDSEERQMKFVQDKIEEKMLILEQMKEADTQGNSMIVRQAEKEIDKLKEELSGLTDVIKTKRKERDEKKEAVARQNAEVKALEMLDRETDDVEDFDDMGIDALLIDEAHEYKHLGFATAMQRGVKGIDPSYSKKAQGVYLKTQAVLEKNNGRNVIFATGTPISNTAAEIWTFMRYLMPADTMKEYGIYYFDDFVRNFGNLTQMLEFTTSGKFKENNRFAGYVNLPELVRIWSSVADTMLNEEIEKQRKERGEESKIPELEGGKAQDIYLPQTRSLRSVMKFVKATLNEYENMSGKEKKENSHIPLTMYGVAKAAAVDTRLVVDNAADEPQSKTNEAVRQILKSLEETKSYKGTVAVFADNYQNKRSGFNLYESIRDKLIAEGVPADQIVIMRSDMTIKKKLEIFDAVNRGDIRVIMGSTFTLGTGVNIQERLHTLIHLDAPNRPMDYTQRNGRILRQGNMHKAWGLPVRVLRFGVEDSLDVTAYQRLKTKGAIADSIMHGNKMMQNAMENRALEEEEDVFGDTVAQLSGSEYAMLKNQAEKDVRKYEAKKKQYEADQTYCHNEMPRLEAEIRTYQQLLEERRKNIATVEALPAEKTITVDGKTFTYVEHMADFFKEYNKTLREVENEMRENPSLESKSRKLTVNVAGIDFVFTTELSVETMTGNQGSLFTAIHRKMKYDCPTLNLHDVPVRQALLREGIEDIMDDVVTGKDFRDSAERCESVIEKDEKSLAQIRERYGKPFEYAEELEKSRARLDEYSELMKKELEEKEKKYAEIDKDVEEADDVTYTEEDEEQEESEEDDDALFRDGENEEPVFYSNAMRAVEGIKQEKATPEQWLAMLQKAGGLKAGEDKWLGLSDWLKASDKKSLTKQEVLDFINSNQIQIEEVNYSANVDIEKSLEGTIQETIGRGKSLEELQEEINEHAESADRYDRLGENPDAYDLDNYLMEVMSDEYGDDFSMGYSIVDGEINYNIDPYDLDEDEYNIRFAGDGNRTINNIRLEYTTEGLENKREIALVVPTIESWNEGDQVHFGDAGNGRAVAWVRFGETTIPAVPAADVEEKRKAAEEASKAFHDYQSQMLKKYDYPMKPYREILNEEELKENDRLAKASADANAAYDKAKGSSERVLVIDEIQSKRHQEGREKGYRGGDTEEQLEEQFMSADKELKDYRQQLYEKYPRMSHIGRVNEFATSEEIAKLDELNKKWDDAYEKNKNKKVLVPDAPFEKNWHELAMKRMLRYAAENGYDKVAWTTGEQQADRYNIGKLIKEISVSRWGENINDGPMDADNPNDLRDVLLRHDSDGILLSVNREGKVVEAPFEKEFEGKQLADIIGKDLSLKVIGTEGKGNISGDALRIGGEGMKGFYDEILPRFMNKYGKKWGVKVNDISLPEIGQTMHSVDVTPEMKESVMQGQPMFRTSTELFKQYPTWLSGQTTSTGQHTTQITSTSKTYQRIGDWMKKEGMDDAKVLDASSGLGAGTQALRDMGFDVEDVEPYPSDKREAPTYTRYEDVDGKYDVVISNAVLNVIPDDWRADVLRSMADKVKEGGKLIINVRDAKSIEAQKQKIELDSPSEILVTDSKGNIRAYQKGFTKSELKEYVESQLGDGWQVDIANEGNSGIKSGTAVVVTRGEGATVPEYRKPADNMREGNEPIGKTSYEENLAASRKAGYTKKQHDTFVRNVRRRMRNMAEDTVAKLNLSDNVVILDTAEGFEGRKARAKGWYERSTEKIYIILDNHTNAEDVMQTILHEAVGHYGLRQLFGRNFNNFLTNVRESAEPQVRQRIYELAKKHGWDFDTATEEYLASLAENTDFERAEYSGWWSKIKKMFLEMLHLVGIRFTGVTFSDNELRYILWRSYENLVEPDRYNNLFNVAADVAKQYELKVGNYSQTEKPYNTVEEDGPMAAEPQQTARIIRLGHIEDEFTDERTLADDLRLMDRVSQLSAAEARAAYERINSQMLDENGLNLEQQEQKDRDEWFAEHGLEGFGKHSANRLQELMDKYGEKMLLLRWSLQDRLEELGEDDVLMRDGDDITEHVNSIPRRYGLFGGAPFQVVSNKEDLEWMKSKVSPEAAEKLQEAYENPEATGAHIYPANFAVIFSEKVSSPEEAELTWWHEQTHGFYYSLPKDKRNRYGKFCFDFLLENFPSDCREIQQNYDIKGWHNEACAYLAEEIIKRLGADNFMTENFEGDEDFINFANDLRDYLKYDTDNQPERTDGRRRDEDNPSRHSDLRGRNSQPQSTKQEEAPRASYRVVDTDRDRAIARSAYERMVSTGLFQFREAVQDSMLGLERLYKAILGYDYNHIEDVPDYENAYLAENLMSSKNMAEQHIYQTRFMQPLLAEISALTGGNEGERIRLVRYMMAKHGLERNEKFAERDFAEYKEKYPDGRLTIHDFRERDYSGLTALTGEADVTAAEAVARQMVDEYEGEQDTADLWDYVNMATKASLEKVYKSGLMSLDTFEKIRDMFEYYIPLQGWDETTSDEVYGYLNNRGAGVGSSPIKHAVGRKSLADDPIATIGMMADAAIRQGNRNLMKQRFYNFALNHPSDLVSVKDLWLHYDEIADEWNPIFPDIAADDTAEEVERKIDEFEERMQQLAEDEPDKYKRGKDAENIPYKVVNGNIKEHQVLVRRGGRTYVLTINGNPRAAQALNGLTNPDVENAGVTGNILKAASWINHHLSAFYTTRNPDFVISNFFRDMLYSNCMSWVKENPRYALRFHKNFGKFNPAVMRRLFGKWQDGTLDMNNRDEYMFYSFMSNGGETGYTNVRDIEEHKKKIKQELKTQNSNTRKVMNILGMQMDLLNRAIENCARFAAFITSYEMGRPIDRCIYDAKEVSVNFNKKGSGGKMVNATGQTILGKVGSYISGTGRTIFVFWNAGMQGLTNFGRAGKRHPKAAYVGAVALFMLGVVTPILAEAIGGGDDDDKNAYYNLPEYVRRTNICIRFGSQWLTIPLPIEFRALYGLGELATGVVTDKEGYSDNELAFQLASQVSQILPIDMLEGGGGISPFIPSTIKPYVESYIMNKSWSGMPIYKDSPFNKNDPEWTKVYSNTDKTLVSISKWLNEATGGDEFKKGKIDFNPAKIEYLLSGTFGGYVSTVEKLKKMAETAVGERDFDWRNMLLANRIVKNGDERTANRKLQNEYFKYLQEYEETGRLLRKYEKADDEGVAGMAEKVDFMYNSPEYLRYELFDEYKKDIDDCRKELQEEISPDERKDLQEEMYGIMRELVDQLREIK